MSTCNRLDLQTLGSQPNMPKNLPDHWFKYCNGKNRLPNLDTYMIGKEFPYLLEYNLSSQCCNITNFIDKIGKSKLLKVLKTRGLEGCKT